MNSFRFKISLLTLLFTSAVLANEPLPLPEKFIIKSKKFFKHTGPQNHITGIDSNRDYTDLDEDGVFDLMDSDIDGDGVENYLDLAPLDKRKRGKDRDKDGIPDFLDFEVGGQPKEGMDKISSLLQSKLWKKKGILLFNGDHLFSNEEVHRIATLYLEKELRILPALEGIKFIFKQPSHSMSYKAKYRAAHSAIILFDNKAHRESALEQELSIVHESFHALSFVSEEVWNEFMELSGWAEDGDELIFKGQRFDPSQFKTNSIKIAEAIQGAEFPNDYSKLGPDEMFAECATASLMARRGPDIKIKYPKLDSYLTTAMHRFFLNSFHRLQK